MKKARNIIFVCLLLSLALLTACQTNEVYVGSNENILYYSLQADGTYEVAGFSGSSEEIVIPAEHEGKPVTSIKYRAFKGGESLTSIVIPDSVINIEKDAFADCTGLQYNTYDNGFYLGNSQNPYLWLIKANKDITSLVISDKTGYIGAEALSYCTELTEITIPENITVIGGNAFLGCYKLASVCNKSSMSIKKGSEGCGKVAFYAIDVYTTDTPVGELSKNGDYLLYENNNVVSLLGYYGTDTYITLPDGITEIHAGAFFRSRSLEYISIPDSVNSIGPDAFAACSAEIRWAGTPTIERIGENAFHSYTGTSIAIPESVKIFNDNAFSQCNSLNYVYYAGSVASWCDISFRNYAANPLSAAHKIAFGGRFLTELVLPSSVTAIRTYAFAGWEGTSITIPESVTTIEDAAFENCDSLETVCYKGDIDSWCSITFGGGETSMGDRNWLLPACNPLCYAHNLCLDGSNLPVTEAVFTEATEITDNSLVGWNGTSVTLPSSLQRIGKNTFEGCCDLATVRYAGNVTSWCGIIFDDTPLRLANKFFIGATLIAGENLTIPKSVTEISPRAFYCCADITAVKLENNVTKIGKEAFYGCAGLKRVIYTGDIASWCRIDFEDASANPLSCAHELTINNTKVTSLSIPYTVTEIKAYAFCNCESLSSVTLPVTTTSIGTAAFSGCKKLTSISYAGTTEQWNELAKEPDWDADTGAYTVSCKNANIKKK